MGIVGLSAVAAHALVARRAGIRARMAGIASAIERLKALPTARIPVRAVRPYHPKLARWRKVLNRSY